MLLFMQSHFVGCYTNCIGFKESLLGVVEVFAGQSLNEKSYTCGEANVKAAAKGLVSFLDGIGARRKKLFCHALRGLCPAKPSLVYIMHLLYNDFRQPSWFEIEKVL